MGIHQYSRVHSVRLQSAILMVVLVAATGCSEWPRFANIPSAGAGVPSTTDPRSLVPIDEWDTQLEIENNDSPVVAQEFLLDLESGSRAVEITGALTGVGWSDLAESEPIVAEGCSENSFVRTYTDPGDYLQDLDFYVIEAAQAGLLCLRLSSDGEKEIGWDLTAYTLDECDVPTKVISDGEDISGFGLGWPAAGWSTEVQAGARIGILVAGYAPNDVEHIEDYALGLSLLNSDGASQIQVCPFTPTETQE